MAGSFRKVIKSVFCARRKRTRGTGTTPVPLLHWGIKMISAWYLIPAVLFGAFVGIAMMALCSTNHYSDEERDNHDE